jgi:hypothetical protein
MCTLFKTDRRCGLFHGLLSHARARENITVRLILTLLAVTVQVAHTEMIHAVRLVTFKHVRTAIALTVFKMIAMPAVEK